MKYGIVACMTGCLLNAPVVLAENEKSESIEEVKAEETLVLGRLRKGDYSYITEDAQKLVETAGSLGDPLGAVFALPGVVYGDSQAPAVRGSSPDDNAFVVDFMPASYIFHDFGVSIFSEYTLHDFQMYASGFGPEFSGATGAIFDVRLKNPENKDFTTTLDVSMLRSGFFVESGLGENSAFYLSARRSLLDLFVKTDEEAEDGLIIREVPLDTDYQFKYLWQMNKRDRLVISANGAGDDAAASFTEEANFIRSNPDFAGDARIKGRYQGENMVWEHFGENGSEMTVGLGQLRDKDELSWGDDYKVQIDYVQNTAKLRYFTPINDQFAIELGGQRTEKDFDYHINQILFVCTEFDPSCDTSRRERIDVRSEFDLAEDYIYSSLNWQPAQTISLNLGGQYHQNDYNDQVFFHPRASVNWTLAEDTEVFAKVGRYHRFADLETVLEETGNPEIKSPTSTHYTVGIKQNFANDWRVSVDAYYKTLNDLPLALPEENSERYASATKGEAYGVDVMINKDFTDKWYGWLALSYGKSNRTNTLTKETKNYNLDTPLIANWVINWQATQRFNLSWRWSVRSGAAYTPIVGIQENPYFEDSVLPIYGDAYSERLPLYSRLDVRMKWDVQTFGKDSSIILDIINATNTQNVEDRMLDYDEVSAPGDAVVTTDEVGLGLIPALSYRVTF